LRRSDGDRLPFGGDYGNILAGAVVDPMAQLLLVNVADIMTHGQAKSEAK
jgi:hypothetical protein